MSEIFTRGSGAVRQWYDSPIFSFTLLANKTYQMGLIVDQEFTYTWDFPGTAVSANGLTLDTGENGNAASFGSPVTIGNGSVVPSIRIFGPADVSEPATVLMLGIGLAGIGFVRRRTRRTA